MSIARSTVLILVLIGSASAAFAHGGGPHILGTVKSIESKSMTVTDTRNNDVTIAVNDKTSLQQDGKAVSLKDVKVGERVAVHTKKTDAGLVAILVKLGKPETTADHHMKARVTTGRRSSSATGSGQNHSSGRS
jgi:hypothetical protein